MKRNLYFDHHLHTSFSPDADPQASMERYIERAQELGIAGFVLTDHLDLDTPVILFQKTIDYRPYYKKFLQLKKQSNIALRMGIEIGYQPHLHEALNDVLGKVPFDFVICSMHLTDQLDYYNGDFFIGKTQDEAYQRYFESVKEAVIAYDNYDVFGHLDYIIRYGDYAIKDYSIERYESIIKEILIIIIKKGKGIEINTSGLRYGLNTTHPKFEVIQWFKELGGTIITIGSDAHKVADLTKDFDVAFSLLKKAGFTSFTVFENRKPTFINF